MKLKDKFRVIRSWEFSFAKAVAGAVIKPKPITVWDIMIPIFFFYNLMDFKRTKDIFTLNFMFTKKLALEAALAIIENGKSKEERMNLVKAETDKILASDKQGVYSEKIRKRQMKEIDLLIDHYCRLLRAEGKDYASLVRDAYRSEESYNTFLKELTQAEKEVNKSAKQTVGTQKASEITSKMEDATERMRIIESRKIFAADHQ